MNSLEGRRLLIVGNSITIHVGAHLKRAACVLGLGVHFCDVNKAFDAAWPTVKFNWWLRGRRAPRLREFGRQVVEACETFKPRWLLVTGMAPLNRSTLEDIGRQGILRINYLTDDPWNPAHRATWFFEALPNYDRVFSPRRSNLDDLSQLGCRHVFYLPFAYEPELHFPEPPTRPKEVARFAADVVFAGGADRDRVPYIDALIQAGYNIALYGGYWERFRETRSHARGHADPPTMRKAIGGAKVALCLVRRANRDGHVMRTFEVPAMGGCMLTEDTEEHREIFGAEGKAVVYFQTISEMIEKLRWLLDHNEESERLAKTAHQLITQGENTYQDRLKTMLSLVEDKR